MRCGTLCGCAPSAATQPCVRIASAAPSFWPPCLSLLVRFPLLFGSSIYLIYHTK